MFQLELALFLPECSRQAVGAEEGETHAEPQHGPDLTTARLTQYRKAFASDHLSTAA